MFLLTSMLMMAMHAGNSSQQQAPISPNPTRSIFQPHVIGPCFPGPRGPYTFGPECAR